MGEKEFERSKYKSGGNLALGWAVYFSHVCWDNTAFFKVTALGSL
jgi:hypothetical protein